MSYERITIFKFRQSRLKDSFQVLFGKLFTVMGVLWIFECVHYLVHGDHRNMDCDSYTELFHRIIGCINLLRGFLIFFIFVCKESIRDKVRHERSE